jgi:hypothetical protein
MLPPALRDVCLARFPNPLRVNRDTWVNRDARGVRHARGDRSGRCKTHPLVETRVLPMGIGLASAIADLVVVGQRAAPVDRDLCLVRFVVVDAAPVLWWLRLAALFRVLVPV